MIHKFKVPPSILETFLSRIEDGYCKYKNPYHNNLHAADVAQSVHYMLYQTGLMVRIKAVDNIILSLPYSLNNNEIYSSIELVNRS